MSDIVVCALLTTQMPLHKPLALSCPFLALHSAIVILQKPHKKQSKQRNLFICTAGAQISSQMVVNILSPFSH